MTVSVAPPGACATAPRRARAACTLLLLGAWLLCAGCHKSPEASIGPASPETQEPTPPAPRLPSIPYKKLDTARLFSGIQLKTDFQAEFGASSTAERQDPGSYELNLQLRVRVPRPHRNLEDLRQLNPALPQILPGLESMLGHANVSPLFEDLYQRKVANVQSNLSRLDQLLSRHNFFDTETILELQHPSTLRRALLVQADMDVDTDGSDGDRAPSADGVSSTFQPFTSYRWSKTGKRPNPFLPIWEKRLRDCEKELASSPPLPAKKKELAELQTRLKADLSDLRNKSFLVGSLDPYVVLPLPMLTRKGDPHAVHVGDFCVVVHGTRLFPAIVGDAGPSYKAGEASLRLCREISQRSGAEARAESDLKVTYLVFPGTAEQPRVAPDFEHWWFRCDALLQELGGYSGELFFFEDPSKPRPVPDPPSVGDPRFIGPLWERPESPRPSPPPGAR